MTITAEELDEIEKEFEQWGWVGGRCRKLIDALRKAWRERDRLANVVEPCDFVDSLAYEAGRAKERQELAHLFDGRPGIVTGEMVARAIRARGQTS